MKSYFFDTSAIFKRYQVEKGTLKVNEIFNDNNAQSFISGMAIIEVISNLKRLYEIDRLTTKSQFLLQRSQFYKDIQEYNISIVELSSEDIITADELISKRYMKPVDAIQLATALNLPIQRLVFVCSDKGLCKIAELEGLIALNPEES